MKLSVRPARTSDSEIAIQTVIASIQELCVADHHNDPATLQRWLSNKTPASFETWINNQENFCVIGEIGGVLSAVGLLHNSGEIRLFYVAPDAQRKGIGKAIHAALEEHASLLNMKNLHLSSTDAARPFYEAVGYQASGTREHMYGQLWCFPYIKQLQPNISFKADGFAAA
ncbi:MAG: GNAT family N-acetyltransferase [Gammaproteobacteria bacterium]